MTKSGRKQPWNSVGREYILLTFSPIVSTLLVEQHIKYGQRNKTQIHTKAENNT